MALVNCQSQTTMGVGPPRTGSKLINGVVVTGSYTGDVSTFTGQICCLSCEDTAYPLSAITDSLRLGTATWFTPSPFQYTMDFDRPVNNVVVYLRGTGLLGSPTLEEEFIFNTNGGVPTITTINSCVSSVVGNSIYSGQGVAQGPNKDNTSGGGRFIITAPSDYTQLVVNGPGGVGGSNFSICLTGAPTTQSTLLGCETIYGNPATGQYSLLDVNVLTSSTLNFITPPTFVYSKLICKAGNLMWIFLPTLQAIREYSIADPNSVILVRSISTSSLGIGNYRSIIYLDTNKLLLATGTNVYEISIATTTATLVPPSPKYSVSLGRQISTGVNPYGFNPYRDYVQGITYFYTTSSSNGIPRQIEAYYDSGILYASGITSTTPPVGENGMLSFNNRLYTVDSVGTLYEITKIGTTLTFNNTNVTIPGFPSGGVGFAQYFPCTGGLIIPPPQSFSGDSCEISLEVDFPCFDLISYTNPTCICNGTITVDAAFGTPPYIFGASDGVSAYTSYNGVFTGLCAGDYIISATDSVGYTQILNQTINLIDSYSVNINSFLNGFCVTVSGGTIPYNIYLDNVLIASVNTDGTTCYTADCATVSVITVVDSTT